MNWSAPAANNDGGLPGRHSRGAGSFVGRILRAVLAAPDVSRREAPPNSHTPDRSGRPDNRADRRRLNVVASSTGTRSDSRTGQTEWASATQTSHLSPI